MSASFILAQIRSAVEDPYALDWAAGLTACTKITLDDLQFDEYDTEERDMLLEEYAVDGMEPTDNASVRSWAVDTVNTLRRTLVEDQETYSIISIGGTRFHYLTGGMSFGDAPNDTYDVICDAHHLPQSVLHAIGFERPAASSPSPDLLEHATADFAPATARVYAALDSVDDIIAVPAVGDIPPATRYIRHADGTVTSETV